MHKLLARQIVKAKTTSGEPDPERLYQLVSEAYEQFDRDRTRSARASRLMIAEVEEHGKALQVALERLAGQNCILDATLENMAHGVAMFDLHRRLVVCNARYATIYGLPPFLTAPGTPFDRLVEHCLVHNIYTAAPHPEYDRRHIDDALDVLSAVHEFKDGRIISVTRRRMQNGGWVTAHEDITERRRAEARIHHMARHDALTDLPNRSFLKESISEGLKRVRRGDAMAVLCMDLDRFKAVNDTLGHPIGDQLLQEVAERIRACIRETDTAARLGGDEFAIVQIGTLQPQSATALAGRLVETLAMPYVIQDHHLVIGCSIGIAMAPADGDEADDLLKKADLALYRAKLDGRGIYRFFEPEMDARVQVRRMLELDLREAIAKQEFKLHYQPLISVNSGEVIGLEALLRWTRAGRGPVSPGEFIPLAEETGLIVPLGEWVIRQACMDAAAWPQHVRVAVNISPIQFRSAALVPTILSAIASSGVAANRLELEITESVLLQNTEATLATLHQLRGAGVRVSMDDFGVGYSSLSYLRSFPFDKIKIDQSFVRDVITNKESLAIIQAVTNLGASLGMATTAEGVETRDQLEQLRANGCTEVQGYYFSKPKPVEEITRLFFPLADAAERDTAPLQGLLRRSG
jgi:diguanylate cyclase (GGDEF)-like protein